MSDIRRALEATLGQARALKRSMEFAASADVEPWGRYGNVVGFAAGLNAILEEYKSMTGRDVAVIDISKWPSVFSSPWPVQKMLFDQVYTQVARLEANLVSQVGRTEERRLEIKDMLIANVRRMLFGVPNSEKEIQDAVERVFVGRGMEKGVDYDRETGRVKYSGKEFIPDFVLPPNRMALEVKFLDSDAKRRIVIDEINADIPALMTAYRETTFLVYDLGIIRDEAEFKRGFEAIEGVTICVVKH